MSIKLSQTEASCLALATAIIQGEGVNLPDDFESQLLVWTIVANRGAFDALGDEFVAFSKRYARDTIVNPTPERARAFEIIVERGRELARGPVTSRDKPSRLAEDEAKLAEDDRRTQAWIDAVNRLNKGAS